MIRSFEWRRLDGRDRASGGPAWRRRTAIAVSAVLLPVVGVLAGSSGKASALGGGYGAARSGIVGSNVGHDSPTPVLSGRSTAQNGLFASSELRREQWTTRYGSAKVELNASTFSLTLGPVSFAQSGKRRGTGVVSARTLTGASYLGEGVKESFNVVATGIEQSFEVDHPIGRPGLLSIVVPVSGPLKAISNGPVVDLVGAGGQVQARYSGLTVFGLS